MSNKKNAKTKPTVLSERERQLRAYAKEIEKKYGKKLSEKHFQEKYLELLQECHVGHVNLETVDMMVAADCEWKSLQEVFALEDMPHHQYRGVFITRDERGVKFALDSACHYALMGQTYATHLPEPGKVRYYYFLPVNMERQVVGLSTRAEVMGIIHSAEELPVDMRLWPKKLVTNYFKYKYSENDREVHVADRERSRAIFGGNVIEQLHQIRQINLTPSKKQLEKVQKEINEDRTKDGARMREIALEEEDGIHAGVPVFNPNSIRAARQPTAAPAWNDSPNFEQIRQTINQYGANAVMPAPKKRNH